jgi:NAD(P)-dependent dehydrogenase (short-subunit alcohol dehydrogenase family)
MTLIAALYRWAVKMQASEMKGRTALVTGVLGMMGKATALKLAGLGANVVLVDVEDPALEKVANSVRSLGVEALIYATDLTLAENCQGAVVETVRAFGKMDALVNVANAFLPSHTTSVSKRDWDYSIALNLSAPFFLMQAAIPHLLKSNGAVVNVTSPVSVLASAFTAAYTASKAGMSQMTKSLAMEYIHESIRFNLVSPGGLPTDTGSVARIPDDLDPALFKRSSPARGTVSVDDVADIVAFLASDASRSYHGACISLDKGVSLGLPGH